MQAARRLYLYAMSGITLAVIAAGLVLLLRVVLDGYFPDPYNGEFVGYNNSREQLSQAIAMLGVGAPVWAVHWWLVQRGLRPGRPERDPERGSTIRAFYLTGILFVSLLAWVPSAIAVLQWFVTDILNAAPPESSLDPVGPVTAALTGFAVWLYHGLVRRHDLAAGPVSGPAAWVPRLYLYGIATWALLVALTTLTSVITSLVWPPELGFDNRYEIYFLVQQIITSVAWGAVWFGHWWYARRLIDHPDWRGTEERVSRARVAAFVVVIVGAFVGAIGGVAAAASSALRQIIPEPGALGDQGDGNLRFAVATLVSAAAWAIVWYAHTRALRREPAAADPLRALHQERLVSHGISATSLAMGAAGAGWLLGLGLDMLLGGQRTAAGSVSLRYDLSQWLPLAVLGLATWAWFWRPVLARRRADPAGEANSTIRRTALYVTLGVALVVAIAAAALILYRFVGIVLGAALGGNLVSELSTPLGFLVTALAVLLYHGLALRSDQRLAIAIVAEVPSAEQAVAGAEPGVAGAEPAIADAEPALAVAEPAAADAEAAVDSVVQHVAAASTGSMAQRRSFTLVAPAYADLDAALAAARAALPPGFEIVGEEG